MSATTPASIVRWLAARGVALLADGADLRVRSRVPLAPQVRERIRAHKPALVAHLARVCAAHLPPELVTDSAGVTGLAVRVAGSSDGVALDCETTGLSPARDRVRLLQVAVGGAATVLDLFAFADPRAALAPLFAVLAEKEIVGHNIVSFDLPFLARLGFVSTRVFDTALASRVVYAGERVDHDLASVVERELGEELDKGERDSDWSRAVLTPSQIAYAAADVAVLLPLADALRLKAAERKVGAVVELEMLCGVPVARMASTGVGFGAGPWLALADEAAERRVALATEMDARVPNPNGLPGMASWNWDSNAGDVPEAFAAVGITLPDTKEETLAGIDHPLAGLLLEYREAAKRTGTYGRGWFGEHVTDGRVFATWNQCQAKTGRMSCKGPNLQQIPRAAAYRRCFVAGPGHVLVKCDYSQIELRVAARVTGDARMLDAYRNGEDLHTLTAARFLGVEPAAVTKEARQLAKPVNFGSIYGLGPRSLRLKARADYGKEMTEDQARGFLDAFFAQYPGVRRWHNRLKCDRAAAVWTLGGRRIAVESDQFYGAKANYVIQGTGGDGLKRALVLLWERRDQCPGAEVVLAVHDEIVIEVPESDAERARGWVERGMIDAMAPLIAPVPVEVEAKVGRTWGG
jgi:DNA polymerase I-like protein with 3'-5' exonuclease and polymerase domains